LKDKKVDELSAIKLRIYPDNEQKEIINNWIGASRFIYNKVLNYINEQSKQNGNSKGLFKIKLLRELFINNDNFRTENSWMLKVPYDIRDEALRDLLKNFKSNFSKGDIFNIKYKSKKSSNQSFNVLSKYWNTKNSMYSKILSSKKLKCETNLPENLKYTSRLIKTKLNEYYLCIPKLIEPIIHENQVSDRKISFDPGSRTFQTGYDPDGLLINIGPNDIGLLARLMHYKNKLQSSLTDKELSHKQRYSMKRAFLRSSEKIKNLVSDLHKKIAKFICSEYNEIIIPRLNFHTMTNLSKRVKSRIVVWNHCGFVDRLISKSREYPNCKIIEVTEEYTSKTCSCCGNLNHKLYASKTFSCPTCLIVIDRDANGSRCIYLKEKSKK
jgi:IS605 OrfB family transposase